MSPDTRAKIIQLCRHMTKDADIANYVAANHENVTAYTVGVIRRRAIADGKLPAHPRPIPGLHNPGNKDSFDLSAQRAHEAMCRDGSERLLKAIARYHVKQGREEWRRLL